MAADGAGLGLSLVDNPVALGRDDLEASGLRWPLPGSKQRA
jgi:hypothetical protein